MKHHFADESVNYMQTAHQKGRVTMTTNMCALPLTNQTPHLIITLILNSTVIVHSLFRETDYIYL